MAIVAGVVGGSIAGYEAYKNGASGWNIAAATAGGAGAGILAGLTGGAVGYWAGTAGATAVEAGVAGGAAGGAVKGASESIVKVSNDEETGTQALLNTGLDTIEGGAAGGTGVLLGPTVQGGWNFNPITSPRTWGPKAWQLYWQSIISETPSVFPCLAGRKC